MKNKNNSHQLYFVIMAGGVGARFWPASRESLPKQFLDILGVGRSLLQMTYDRISSLAPPENILILTHENYKNQVTDHLPDIPIRNILTEPARRNTAPCIAYVSLHIQARDPDANIVILPADHLITKEKQFLDVVQASVEYVDQNDDILTLGMKPHRPDTGYGYIHLGKPSADKAIFHVRSFTEKPDLPTAQEYLSKDEYVWNAGIFISSVKTMLQAFRQHAPEIYDTLYTPHVFGTEKEKAHIDQSYGKSPSISIDFAIMEKAKNMVCMPASIGWSDVGTWKSLYDLQQKDNLCINLPSSEVITQHSDSILVYGTEGKKYLIRGLKNMILVDRKDILMVWPLEEEQEIKDAKENHGSQWMLE